MRLSAPCASGRHEALCDTGTFGNWCFSDTRHYCTPESWFWNVATECLRPLSPPPSPTCSVIGENPLMFPSRPQGEAEQRAPGAQRPEPGGWLRPEDRDQATPKARTAGAILSQSQPPACTTRPLTVHALLFDPTNDGDVNVCFSCCHSPGFFPLCHEVFDEGQFEERQAGTTPPHPKRKPPLKGFYITLEGALLPFPHGGEMTKSRWDDRCSEG